MMFEANLPLKTAAEQLAMSGQSKVAEFLEAMITAHREMYADDKSDRQEHAREMATAVATAIVSEQVYASFFAKELGKAVERMSKKFSK